MPRDLSAESESPGRLLHYVDVGPMHLYLPARSWEKYTRAAVLYGIDSYLRGVSEGYYLVPGTIRSGPLL